MLLLFQFSNSQVNRPSKDSTISFKVFGVCDQCKARIEKAAKGKGVKSAEWDVESNMLLLAFNPKLTSIEKVQDRIIAAGYDLENKKADDAIIAADQPFSPYFDASLVWGPVSGRMLYAGMRFKVK